VRLAILLSLAAGLVNSEGFLGFAVLTTNVTGHAALFAESISLKGWPNAGVIALWMLLFLGGAFLSSFIQNSVGRNQRYSYLIPISLECLILVTNGCFGSDAQGIAYGRQLFAGSLLFAMGLQNALVSLISKSVVRTTHLTGTFTDLGIELAQLKFIPQEGRPQLKARIRLRLYIIIFFIVGALFGAYAFRSFRFYSFFIPAAVVILTLLYDVFRITAKWYYRKLEQKIKTVKTPA
jgi:uncharacterized membrane protein YoaK (UPF0700 family)